MKISNIEYIIAITKAKSISKAAEELHISQQSLSEQLKKIEEEVGAVLIERGKPMTLTAAGNVFIDEATKLLNSYYEMLDKISDVSEKNKTRINLAIPATEMPLFLPELLNMFSREHPETEIKIIRIEPKEAAEQTRSFDLYFSTLPLGMGLENITVKKDEYVVALSQSLAKTTYGDQWDEVEKELISSKSIYAIKEMPFIFLSNRLNEIVLDQQMIFQEAGFKPNNVFQSDNSELNSNMCKLGVGAYVASRDYSERRFGEDLQSADGIRIYPINTIIDPAVIALSYRKNRKLSRIEREFIEATREFLNKQ